MGNMFKCVLVSGTGNGIPLIVTCTSAFAGLTITCTDGTTTLTDTCPSSSPYEITFNLPNTGTWTVSGTISGTTYSESILVQDFNVELKNNIDLAVDLYSAANDTVSYTGAIDGQTHTITTDSSGHASATITIPPTGATITFTSSVAKDPDNLSNDYSKSIALTSSTTSVYVMPDNTLYWFGYDDTETISAANGWSYSGYTIVAPTYNTNYVTINASKGQVTGIGSHTSHSNINVRHLIADGKTGSSSVYGGFWVTETKNITNRLSNMQVTTQGLSHTSGENTAPTGYIEAATSNASNSPVNTRSMDLYAMWFDET